MEITQPGSHYDHLLRQTRMHQEQLSAMADFKANMLLTVSSVMSTIALAHLGDPALRWPLAILIVACLCTIGLSAYATMPALPGSLGNRIPQASDPMFNILFFGHFYRMSYQDYEREMQEILTSPSRAYEVQIREIYGQGIFLAKRKFRIIRWAYITFLAGSLLSVSACGLLWFK